MANIEIIYRKKWCLLEFDAARKNFCNFCFDPESASCVCEYFCADRTWAKSNEAPCANACIKYVYKGWTGKKYEMEQMSDYVFGDYMLVTLGNQIYECERVTLNGKCIFDQYEEENNDTCNEKSGEM